MGTGQKSRRRKELEEYHRRKRLGFCVASGCDIKPYKGRVYCTYHRMMYRKRFHKKWKIMKGQDFEDEILPL